MADKTMKFGEAPEEQKNEILEKMRKHGIMLPNIDAWGYDKAIARVEALIAAKTAQNEPENPETPDKPEAKPEESENKGDAEKTENVQNIAENAENVAENAENSDETPDKPEAETPAEEIKEEKKPHYDGLCHICRSAVYDGVCSGCGFTLRR